MEFLQSLLSLDTTIITIAGYGLSPLELAGTLAGLLCVWLTAREKILCWPVGIVNILAFFVMFYQLRLYSDMLLQVYFLVMSLYGWWKWLHPRDRDEAKKDGELKVTRYAMAGLGAIFFLLAAGTLALGMFVSSVHTLLPGLFPEQAAFPFIDSFIAAGSVLAQYLMARKKLECWFLWLSVDIVAVYVYASKGIYLVTGEYLVFASLALYALILWKKEMELSNDTPGTPTLSLAEDDGE